MLIVLCQEMVIDLIQMHIIGRRGLVYGETCFSFNQSLVWAWL